jgi:hypothetical protein
MNGVSRSINASAKRYSILEPTYNREAENHSYDIKKPVYAKSEIQMSKSIVKEYEEWGVLSILDRANKLLKLIGEAWPESI